MIRCYFKTTTGPVMEITERETQKRHDAMNRYIDYGKKFGFNGVQPTNKYTIRGFIFYGDMPFSGDMPPEGWRKTYNLGETKIECVPKRNTKLGKQYAKEILDIENEYGEILNDQDIARKLKFPTMVADGSYLYFASATLLSLPEKRVLISCPMDINDKVPDIEGLEEITGSEYRTEFEIHNNHIQGKK